MADDPITAGYNRSPAEASSPDQELDDRRYHTYQPNPVPWWVAVMWAAFFAFGFGYLLLNLMRS